MIELKTNQRTLKIIHFDEVREKQVSMKMERCVTLEDANITINVVSAQLTLTNMENGKEEEFDQGTVIHLNTHIYPEYTKVDFADGWSRWKHLMGSRLMGDKVIKM